MTTEGTSLTESRTTLPELAEACRSCGWATDVTRHGDLYVCMIVDGKKRDVIFRPREDPYNSGFLWSLLEAMPKWTAILRNPFKDGYNLNCDGWVCPLDETYGETRAECLIRGFIAWRRYVALESPA